MLTQIGFFALFLLAPPLDLLRIDLNLGHAIFFGQDWTLGIDDFLAGRADIADAALNLLLLGLLPLALIGGLLIGSAWRWGRLYCGWLCPHFSVVELINRLMRRASGRPTLWERQPLPREQADGHVETPSPRYWLPTVATAIAFAFLWAVVLLTYLLPPAEVYGNLFHGRLTANQFTFIAVATAALSVEFLFARHLFCRYACAVGLFQSLAWMANRDAMVVGFAMERARERQSCNNACDNACPMRLKPRGLKRKMFTCTECGECVSACIQVQARQGEATLMRWVEDEAAHPIAEPTLGQRRESDTLPKPA